MGVVGISFHLAVEDFEDVWARLRRRRSVRVLGGLAFLSVGGFLGARSSGVGALGGSSLSEFAGQTVTIRDEHAEGDDQRRNDEEKDGDEG